MLIKKKMLIKLEKEITRLNIHVKYLSQNALVPKCFTKLEI